MVATLTIHVICVMCFFHRRVHPLIGDWLKYQNKFKNHDMTSELLSSIFRLTFPGKSAMRNTSIRDKLRLCSTVVCSCKCDCGRGRVFYCGGSSKQRYIIHNVGFLCAFDI